jgi:hypothetical protein
VIVISGALVLVALVLLVIGLIGPSLGFVYASIGASLAAFAFLVVGILQRRKEESVGIEGAPTSAAELTAAIRTPETRPVSVEKLAGAAELSGEVLVVEGRPRYHVAGCRYLTGKEFRGIDVVQARADGFTACGVCKPDEALAAAPATAAAVTDVVEEVAVITLPATATKAPAGAARAVKAPAKTAAKTASKAPAKAAATKAPAKKAAAANPATKTVSKAPAKAAKAAAPAKAARPAKAATPAKAAPAKAAPTKVAKAVSKAPAKKAAPAAKKAAPAKATKAPARKAARR